MIFVILPCYNEEGNLRKLIPRIDETLRGMKYVIIAVNDGSSDNTEGVLKELSKHYPIIIVTHFKNKGLHSALLSGILKALELGGNINEDVIVTMDADNTHNPKDILKMLDKFQEGYDVVIASRYIKGGKQLNVPFIRVFLSRGINTLLKITSELDFVNDLTSGFRAYRLKCLKTAYERLGENFITSRGFEVSVELLIKVYYFGRCCNIVEIPTVLDYGKKEGISKMKIWYTIYRYLILIWRIHRWKKRGQRYE